MSLVTVTVWVGNLIHGLNHYLYYTTGGDAMPAYKDSKKNTWYVKFRYTDWQGNRKETTKRGFQTKREAKEYEAEFIRKAQGTADMTLKSLYEIYLEDKRKQVKPSSLLNITNTIDTYILPTLGDKVLTDISTNTIRQWQNHLASLDKKTGGKLQPMTLLTINRRLSALLNFAVKYYNLPRNPLAITGAQGKFTRRLDFWSKDEFEQFMAEVNNPMYEGLFTLLFYSGMRIGEALALDKSDFVGSKVTINKTIDHRNNITPPKTKSSERTIILPNIAVKALNNVCEKLPDTKRIFPITYVTAGEYYRKVVAKAGVRYLPIHALRHSHASMLIANGVPITAVSKRLGHSSPQVTLSVYAHALSDSEQSIADKLNSL
jgi:integrase